MTEEKATTENIWQDIDFVYVVEDEMYPMVRDEIHKGLTKDKGVVPVDTNLKPPKYKHKSGVDCLICKKYKDPSPVNTVSKEVKIHEVIQTALHEDDILSGPPPNSAIVSIGELGRSVVPG